MFRRLPSEQAGIFEENIFKDVFFKNRGTEGPRVFLSKIWDYLKSVIFFFKNPFQDNVKYLGVDFFFQLIHVQKILPGKESLQTLPFGRICLLQKS